MTEFTEDIGSCCTCVRRLQAMDNWAKGSFNEPYDFAITKVHNDLPLDVTKHLVQVQCMSCGVKFYAGRWHEFYEAVMSEAAKAKEVSSGSLE